MRYPGKEKRKFPRITRAYPISFKNHSNPGTDWDISNTRDLSLGGALFLSSEFLPAGTQLDISLKMPSRDTNCQCRGIVKRCVGPVKNAYYQTAVSFNAADAYFENLLKKSIDFFLEASK